MIVAGWIEEWKELAEADDIGRLDPDEGEELDELTNAEASTGAILEGISESAD
jgi:hypothetical protein